MSFSSSPSSFRKTSVRSFIEDNEDILGSLDFASGEAPESDYYYEYSDGPDVQEKKHNDQIKSGNDRISPPASPKSPGSANQSYSELSKRSLASSKASEVMIQSSNGPGSKHDSLGSDRFSSKHSKKQELKSESGSSVKSMERKSGESSRNASGKESKKSVHSELSKESLSREGSFFQGSERKTKDTDKPSGINLSIEYKSRFSDLYSAQLKHVSDTSEHASTSLSPKQSIHDSLHVDSEKEASGAKDGDLSWIKLRPKRNHSKSTSSKPFSPGTSSKEQLSPTTASKERLSQSGSSKEHFSRETSSNKGVPQNESSKEHVSPGTSSTEKLLENESSKGKFSPGTSSKERFSRNGSSKEQLSPGTSSKERFSQSGSSKEKLSPGISLQKKSSRSASPNDKFSSVNDHVTLSEQKTRESGRQRQNSPSNVISEYSSKSFPSPKQFNPTPTKSQNESSASSEVSVTLPPGSPQKGESPSTEPSFVSLSKNPAKFAKTPTKRMSFTRHNRIRDSYQTYMENQKRLIAERWAHADAERVKEDEHFQDYEIFTGHIRKPYTFTGIKRKNVEPAVPPQEPEFEPVKRKPPKYDDSDQPPFHERVLMKKSPPKAKRSGRKSTPESFSEFYERQNRSASNKRKTYDLENTQQSPSRPIDEATFKRFNTIRAPVCEPPPPSKPSPKAKPVTKEIWRFTKAVAPEPEPLNPDDFRDLRFGEKSRELTQGVPPLVERDKRDFRDMLEEFRAETYEQRQREAFNAQYE